MDPQHINSVIQIFTEFTFSDQSFDIAVGGGNGAHVHAQRLRAAQRLYLPFLQRALAVLREANQGATPRTAGVLQSIATAHLALDLAPEGIRVNAVCPGQIMTDLERWRFGLEAQFFESSVEAREAAALALVVRQLLLAEAARLGVVAEPETDADGRRETEEEALISTLLLTLAAIPLSRSRPRQGRYAKMLFALGIYAVYFNLLDVARSWVEQGSSRSIWWVPALLAVVVTGMYAPVVAQKWKDRRAQD